MVAMPPFILDKPVSFLPDRDMGFGIFWDYLVNGKGIHSLTPPMEVYYKREYYYIPPYTNFQSRKNQK
jgi:hypothetical protein